MSVSCMVSSCASIRQQRLWMSVAHVAEDGTIHGEVLRVDRFGNLSTNLTRELLPIGQQLRVQIAGREVSGPVASYAQVREGELLALFGSSGYLEIAARNDNAATALQASPGTPVVAIAFKRRDRVR